MSKYKYQTWRQVIDAFASGELSKSNHRLVMDNDVCHLYDKESIACVFQGGGPRDIVELLQAIGIETDWC